MGSKHPNSTNTYRMIEFITVRRESFSTGFSFDYWNESDQLFVRPKYRTLKEEVIESGYLGEKKWKNKVVLRAERYLWSRRGRKMRSKGRGFGVGCNTKEGTPVTLLHLCAIILYCNFSDLCTRFSETFRVADNDVFESVQSVMNRHSVFAIFGKLLVELVQDFGDNGKGGESGPFWCGINCVLNIGSFAICLKGPCSTSTAREIAINFADERGMILKLDNDSLSAQYQCCFSTPWISCFPEEAERLWVGGDESLRIASLLMVKTANNYTRIMRILYIFDAMISGVLLGDEMEMTPADWAPLSNLIEHTLDNTLKSWDLDSFEQNHWNLFIQRKEEIILDLYALDNGFQSLSGLVMSNVQYNWSKIGTDKDNILKAQWLRIFPSLRTVSIITAGKSYRFDLEKLLKVVQQMETSVTLMVFDMGQWCKHWLTYKDYGFCNPGQNCRDYGPERVAAYNRIGWDISYHDDVEMDDDANRKMNRLVIKHRNSWPWELMMM